MSSTIGNVKLLELKCFHELCNDLSILLDIQSVTGEDYRLLLEKFGISYLKVVNLSRHGEGSPTRKGLERCGWSVDVSRLVLIFGEMERIDCVEATRKTLFRHLNEEHKGDPNITIDDILQLDVSALSYDLRLLDGSQYDHLPHNMQQWTHFSKLLYLLILNPLVLCVYNIPEIVLRLPPFLLKHTTNAGKYYITFVTRESWILLRAIVDCVASIVNKYIIRTRTDDGFVSFWLVSLSVVERFVLIFLIFNDIVLLTPFWETGHTFSMLEHLVVALPVYISWFMEPRMSKLHDTSLRKTALLQLKEEFPPENVRINQKISSLERREKAEMIEVRNALMCLIPLQISVLLGCCYILSCGLDRVTRMCYVNVMDFFRAVVLLHLADVFYRVFVFVKFYIPLDPTGRFYFSHSEIKETKRTYMRNSQLNLAPHETYPSN